MRGKQSGILQELTATFPTETVDKWKDQIRRWNRDKVNETDPYEDHEQSKHLIRASRIALNIDH